MRKKLLLILCALILTGCDVTYNLTITDISVNESADFSYSNSAENQSIVDSYYKNNYLAFHDIDTLKDNMYNKEQIISDDRIGMNLNYSYLESADYQYSSLLDQCYYKKSFMKDSDYIVLYTEGGATCFNRDGQDLIDTLTINIKTDLKVMEHNADVVNGNIYTWKLTKANSSDKDVYIKIKRAARTEKSSVLLIALLIFGGVFIAGVLIILFVRFQNNKNNKL